MNNQSHLILPVVLAAIALTGIGFAIAALVGTGAEASGTSASQITIHSTVTTPGATITKVATKRIPAKTITKNGKVTTLPAHSVNVYSTITAPGHNVTNTRTTTHTVTGAPRTVTSPPVTVTSPPVTVTSPPITVTSPPVTVTATVSVPVT